MSRKFAAALLFTCIVLVSFYASYSVTVMLLSGPEDYKTGKIVQKIKDAYLLLDCGSWAGSGFYATIEGYDVILTAAHVAGPVGMVSRAYVVENTPRGTRYRFVGDIVTVFSDRNSDTAVCCFLSNGNKWPKNRLPLKVRTHRQNNLYIGESGIYLGMTINELGIATIIERSFINHVTIDNGHVFFLVKGSVWFGCSGGPFCVIEGDEPVAVGIASFLESRPTNYPKGGAYYSTIDTVYGYIERIKSKDSVQIEPLFGE